MQNCINEETQHYIKYGGHWMWFSLYVRVHTHEFFQHIYRPCDLTQSSKGRGTCCHGRMMPSSYSQQQNLLQISFCKGLLYGQRWRIFLPVVAVNDLQSAAALHKWKMHWTHQQHYLPLSPSFQIKLDTTHFTDVTGLVYYHIRHPIVTFLTKTIEKKEFYMLETVSAFTLIGS